MTLSCCPHLSARCLRWLVRSGDFVNNGYSVATFKAIPLAYNLLVAIAPSDVPAPEDLPSYSGSVRRPGLQLIDALPHPLVIDNHALTRAFSLSLVTGAISVLVPCNCLQYVLPNAPSLSQSLTMTMLPHMFEQHRHAPTKSQPRSVGRICSQE